LINSLTKSGGFSAPLHEFFGEHPKKKGERLDKRSSPKPTNTTKKATTLGRLALVD
jgi:hypothetical protein